MCKKQAQKSMTRVDASVANFVKRGGGTPHVLQSTHARIANTGGFGRYLYVRNIRATYMG